MIYIMGLGKLLCLFGVIAFGFSGMQYVQSRRAKSKHEEDHFLYEFATDLGWSIGLLLLGALCLLAPVLLPLVVRLVLFLLKILLNIITLPFRLL